MYTKTIMNRAKWKTLTEEEQQIRVAELCEYKDIHRQEFAVSGNWDYTYSVIVGMLEGWEKPQQVPDYLNDLNAMHKAELYMRSEFDERVYIKYVTQLISLMGVEHMNMNEKLVGATATQRAEAFVLIMAKEKSI